MVVPTESAGDTLALPNAVWGSLGQGYREEGVYGRSAVMGEKLCAIIVRSCKAWGAFPFRFPEAGGYFQLPVDSSERSAGMPGGVLAVAVTPKGRDFFKRDALFFHAVFLCDDDFAELGYQTFGLWRSGAFMAEWNGRASLPFTEVSKAAAQAPPLLPLKRGQAVVLRRELREVLLGGSVAYTAFAPQPDLSEHLRLLQLGLPTRLRRDLGFSVFLGEGALVGVGSPFAIAAKHGPGAFQVGRSIELPRHRRPRSTEASIEAYVGRYEQLLMRGSVDELQELAQNGI